MKQNFQILNDRLMDRLLSVQPNKGRYKSALPSPAQTGTQCATGHIEDPAELVPESARTKIAQQNPRLLHLINFMTASSCRISEALKVNYWEITKTGHVKLHQSKGSGDRIVHSGMAMQYLLECLKSKRQPWADWNRFFVYREFKKFGIGLQLQGRKKKSITHSVRHTVAKQMKRAGMTIDDSKQALGQKNVKSTAYYHE